MTVSVATPFPSYSIKTILDFAKVPTERREACLSEFLMWLSMNDAGRELLSGLPVKWPEEFVWVDDNLHTVTMSVCTPDGRKIPIGAGVMKGGAGG